MNIEQAKVYLADLKAKTQVVEWFIEDGKIDIMLSSSGVTSHDPDFGRPASAYRRTPKPTYVPFTLDTFPKCPTWVRSKKGIDSCPRIIGELAVTGVSTAGLAIVGQTWEFEKACHELEISLDHRATWQPCGQAVKSPQTKDL